MMTESEVYAQASPVILHLHGFSIRMCRLLEPVAELWALFFIVLLAYYRSVVVKFLVAGHYQFIAFL